MTPAIAVPKGDPAFGEKIAHLPKDERKKYKSSDPDRVARRLAKKKARMALDMRGSTKPLTKIRDRVRKSSAVKAVGSRKEGKKRVRSEKSRAKQNTKK
jgi:nucleolar protein 12